jgi:hypothetical protein
MGDKEIRAVVAGLAVLAGICLIAYRFWLGQ